MSHFDVKQSLLPLLGTSMELMKLIWMLHFYIFGIMSHAKDIKVALQVSINIFERWTSSRDIAGNMQGVGLFIL